MPKVGDQVQVATSKAGPRVGEVVAVSGALVTVRWGSGEQTTLVPGPGVLTVLASTGAAKRAPTAKKPAPAKKTPAKKTPAKKAPATKKAAGKKTTAKKAVAKKTGSATKKAGGAAKKAKKKGR